MANLDELIRKTQGQQYADGLLELMLGIFMLIAATALGFLSEPFLSSAIALGLIITTAFFFRRLQMRISVPRTGYVRYWDQSKKGRKANAITGIITMIIILSVFLWRMKANPNNAMSWLVLSVCVVIGLALILLGLRLGIKRLVVPGVVSLLLGLWVTTSTTGTGFTEPMSMYFLGIGISLTIAGGIVLSRFTKANPIQKGDNDE